MSTRAQAGSTEPPGGGEGAAWPKGSACSKGRMEGGRPKTSTVVFTFGDLGSSPLMLPLSYLP